MAAQQPPKLSEASLNVHNAASALQGTGNHHFQNAIHAERAQIFYQTLGLHGFRYDGADLSTSLHLESQQTTAGATPRETFAVLSASDDPNPLYCKLAMQGAAVDYASLESIGKRQRIAHLNMQSMRMKAKKARFSRRRSRSSSGEIDPRHEQREVTQQGASDMPKMLEMQQANVQVETNLEEDVDEGYGSRDSPSARLNQIAK